MGPLEPSSVVIPLKSCAKDRHDISGGTVRFNLLNLCHCFLQQRVQVKEPKQAPVVRRG